MKRLLAITCSAVLLSACAAYSLVTTQPTKVGSAFQVKPVSEWSKRSTGDLELWTQDGSILQELVFVTGISNGDTLFPETAQTSTKSALPEFDDKASQAELLEYVKASLSAIKVQDIQDRVFEPHKFGGENGFHMEFDMASQSGLEYRASVFGAIRKNKLYAVIFYGTRLHYFEKLRPEVETIVNSLTFL